MNLLESQLVRYYCSFITEFAKIAALLTRKMTNQVQWNSKCEQAFECLKESLSLLKAPVLAVVDPEKSNGCIGKRSWGSAESGEC